jgi:capsular exopolysaccharide synthesis family protein
VEPVASARIEPSVAGSPAPAIDLAGERPRLAADHLVSLFDPTSYEAEQYRVLRHTVETLRKGANLQVVALTSAGVGDGKSTTAINLAGSLAQSPQARVLLADLDLRRPSVAHRLGLSGSKRGCVDALVDPSVTLEETVVNLARFNLSVLPAGRPAVAPYELLKSPRLEALLDEARQRYDYIVLDTPPFVPVPDCRLIAKCVDGFLIVVAAHRTPRGAVAETLDLIDPGKVMGLVFNGNDAHRASYYDVYSGSSRASRRRPWGKGKR